MELAGPWRPVSQVPSERWFVPGNQPMSLIQAWRVYSLSRFVNSRFYVVAAR